MKNKMSQVLAAVACVMLLVSMLTVGFAVSADVAMADTYASSVLATEANLDAADGVTIESGFRPGELDPGYARPMNGDAKAAGKMVFELDGVLTDWRVDAMWDVDRPEANPTFEATADGTTWETLTYYTDVCNAANDKTNWGVKSYWVYGTADASKGYTKLRVNFADGGILECPCIYSLDYNFVTAAPNPVPGVTGNAVVAPYLDGTAITVDGVKDAAYDECTKQSITDQNLGRFPDSPQNTTGEFWLTYDEDFIYLYVDITDPVIDYSHPNNYETWNRDSIGIILDFDYIRTADYYYDGTENICYINLSGDNVLATYHKYGKQHYAEAFEKIETATVSNNGNGHILYEVAMPYPMGVDVSVGTNIGFEVCAIDSVDGGRVGHISWSEDGSFMDVRTDVLGTLILEEVDGVTLNPTASVFPMADDYAHTMTPDAETVTLINADEYVELKNGLNELDGGFYRPMDGTNKGKGDVVFAVDGSITDFRFDMMVHNDSSLPTVKASVDGVNWDTVEVYRTDSNPGSDKTAWGCENDYVYGALDAADGYKYIALCFTAEDGIFGVPCVYAMDYNAVPAGDDDTNNDNNNDDNDDDNNNDDNTDDDTNPDTGVVAPVVAIVLATVSGAAIVINKRR